MPRHQSFSETLTGQLVMLIAVVVVVELCIALYTYPLPILKPLLK